MPQDRMQHHVAVRREGNRLSVQVLAIALSMAVPLAPTAAWAASAPTGPAWPALSPTAYQAPPVVADIGPELATDADLAILDDPLMLDVAKELEATGFWIMPAPLERDNGVEHQVVFFSVAGEGDPVGHHPDDALWTDSVRLGVMAVLEHDHLVGVVEMRLTQIDGGRPCIMYEGRSAEHPSHRVRAVDRYFEAGPEREVTVFTRDVLGAIVLVSSGGADRLSWKCVKDCFKDAGIKISTFAAICLAACFVAAGIALILGGGSAAKSVLKACVSLCKKSILAKATASAAGLIECIGDCT